MVSLHSLFTSFFASTKCYKPVSAQDFATHCCIAYIQHGDMEELKQLWSGVQKAANNNSGMWYPILTAAAAAPCADAMRYLAGEEYPKFWNADDFRVIFEQLKRPEANPDTVREIVHMLLDTNKMGVHEAASYVFYYLCSADHYELVRAALVAVLDAGHYAERRHGVQEMLCAVLTVVPDMELLERVWLQVVDYAIKFHMIDDHHLQDSVCKALAAALKESDKGQKEWQEAQRDVVVDLLYKYRDLTSSSNTEAANTATLALIDKVLASCKDTTTTTTSGVRQSLCTMTAQFAVSSLSL